MSFLAQLKNETTECHGALEKSLDILRRVQTREDYRLLLARFFTLYQPLEERLAASADWRAMSWDFSKRLKTPWLREDLLALGVPEEEIGAWAPCKKLPACENFGETVGALYVIEGSTLGGQVISRTFQEKLAITPDRSGRFFQGYGAATGPHWRAFGLWAEAQALAANGALVEPAIRGARQTFEAFSLWLT